MAGRGREVQVRRNGRDKNAFGTIFSDKTAQGFLLKERENWSGKSGTKAEMNRKGIRTGAEKNRRAHTGMIDLQTPKRRKAGRRMMFVWNRKRLQRL